MGEITNNVNWMAVIIGAVISYGLGWLWYSPKLFGNKWMECQGMSTDDISGPPMTAMIVQAIGTFLLAWVVGVTASNNALLTVFLVILTLVFLMAGGGLYSQKKSNVIAIEVGYVIVMSAIMIVCQGIF